MFRLAVSLSTNQSANPCFFLLFPDQEEVSGDPKRMMLQELGQGAGAVLFLILAVLSKAGKLSSRLRHGCKDLGAQQQWLAPPKQNAVVRIYDFPCSWQ